MHSRCLAVAILIASAPARADEATPSTTAESEPRREPTGRFEIGAGFSPDDGFIAHAKIARDDLFGTGQRLALAADISAIQQRFLVTYDVPDALGTGIDLHAELLTAQHQYTGFMRESAGGAISASKRVDRHTRVYARYRVEHVAIDVAPIDGAANRVVGMPRLGDGLLATLGVGLEYSTLDAPFLPRRGTRLALFADKADPRIGSDYELLRAGAAFDHARPLGPFTLRLSGHATMVKSHDPMGVPLAYRLFHEGHAAVRGYALDSASAVGDNVEAIGHVELELPVIPKWGLSIAGFFDAGVRYSGDAGWGPPSALLQRSVGASIIWRSPIGPLRFDWAIPLDGGKRDHQFLFALGGGF